MSVVTGDKKLDKLLRTMRVTAARRATNLGMKKAVQQLAKDIKSTIPSRYKGVRKAVGWRSMKVEEAPGGGAKVGAAVGKKLKKITQTDRTGRKGVGIDARNIHWWFMGTGQRKTKTGRRTGSMPPQGEPISVLASQKNSQTMGILRTWVWTGIKKEIAKGKAF